LSFIKFAETNYTSHFSSKPRFSRIFVEKVTTGKETVTSNP
jgi:hypothetical protein